MFGIIKANKVYLPLNGIIKSTLRSNSLTTPMPYLKVPTILDWIIWSFKQALSFQLNNTHLKSMIGASSVIYYFDEAHRT